MRVLNCESEDIDGVGAPKLARSQETPGTGGICLAALVGSPYILSPMETLLDIPTSLRAPVAAALQWVNDNETNTFELTGLVDTDAALSASPGQAFELGLVLCDGDICARQQIRFTPQAQGFSYAFADEAQREIPPLLDPPSGVRSTWLDNVLQKHEFVLLLFYRGLW